MRRTKLFISFFWKQVGGLPTRYSGLYAAPTYIILLTRLYIPRDFEAESINKYKISKYERKTRASKGN